jgi:SAM-dependent methyltransferase
MKHLDIGCGYDPQNPYDAEELFGIDIYPEVTQLGTNFRCANLAIEGIPFPDDYLDSISAFDVIEHIPRQAIDFQNKTVKLPFINLMNEIHCCLKLGGLFYASTPVYPSEEVFRDPTHVNFITNKTHQYFCGDDCYGKRYGFKGNFSEVEVTWLYYKFSKKAFRSKYISLKSWYKRFILSTPRTHLIWQLKALK